jgi:hypothetical protein
VKRLIADEATATRIGHARAAKLSGWTAKAITVFSYQQHRTGLTLFGVELETFDGNGTRQTEVIVSQ